MHKKSVAFIIYLFIITITQPTRSSFITNYLWPAQETPQEQTSTRSSTIPTNDSREFLKRDKNLLAHIYMMRWVKEIAMSEKGYDEKDPQQEKFFSFLKDLADLNPNKKVILSMDGGGIRGTITITMLMILKEVFEIELHHLFDLIAGTSVGGIISAVLCASEDGKKRKLSLEEVYSMFMDGKATHLFSNKRIKNILDTMAKGLKIGSNIHSLYKTSDLINLLSALGETKLSKSLTPVMFTTVNEETKEDFTVKSWKSKQGGKYLDFYMKDMALATATVKPYFAVREISPVGDESKKFYLSDGGIYDLSPAKRAYESLAKHTGKPEDIILISLGTGTDIDPETGKSSFNINNQGIVKVLNNIAPDMIDICSSATHKKILKKPHIKPDINYFRMNPFLDQADRAVDNASQKNLKALQDAATNFIKNNLEQFYKLVYVLARTKAHKIKAIQDIDSSEIEPIATTSSRPISESPEEANPKDPIKS